MATEVQDDKVPANAKEVEDEVRGGDEVDEKKKEDEVKEKEIEEKVEEEGGEEEDEENKAKKRKRDRKPNKKKLEEKKEVEEEKKDVAGDDEEEVEDEDEPEKKKSSPPSSPKEVATPKVERPTRERKAVERYSIASPASRASGGKPLEIAKGSGTLLKDIPNVAYKLSKRKPDDNLQLLHMILFGKKAKVHNLKKDIGRFSGFVWGDNKKTQSGEKRRKTSEADEKDNDLDSQSNSSDEEDESPEKAVSDQETESEQEEEETKEKMTTPKSSSKENSGAKNEKKPTNAKKSTSEKSAKKASVTPKKSAAAVEASASVSSPKTKGSLSKNKKADVKTQKEKAIPAEKPASKKQGTKSAPKSAAKDQGKGKTKKEAKAEPTNEDLRAQAVHILKEVDFNTATLFDILRLLGTHFDLDLMHRKAEVKAIIFEVIETRRPTYGTSSRVKGSSSTPSTPSIVSQLSQRLEASEQVRLAWEREYSERMEAQRLELQRIEEERRTQRAHFEEMKRTLEMYGQMFSQCSDFSSFPRYDHHDPPPPPGNSDTCAS